MNQPLLVEQREGETLQLQMSLIFPNPNQPRTLFVESEIQELANGIKEHGLRDEIVVRPQNDGTYQIVSGERRYRAHILNNAKVIRAKIENVPNGDLLLESVIYNNGRKSLTPRDAFNAIVKLIDEGKSIETIATAFCRKPSWVKSYLKFRDLAPELQVILKHEGADGELSPKDALQLVELKNHTHQLNRWDKTKKMTPGLRQKLLKTAVQQTNKTAPKQRTPTKREKGKALTQAVERFHLFLKSLNEEGEENLMCILRNTPSINIEVLEESTDSCIEMLKILSRKLNKLNR